MSGRDGNDERLRRLGLSAGRELVDRAPPGLVRTWARSAGLVSRFTARTPHGARALTRALSLLAPPSRANPRRTEPSTLKEIAESLGRGEQTVKAWADAGLLGAPQGAGAPARWPPSAVERARLVAYLSDHGIDEKELRAAAAQDRLPLLVVDRALGAAGELTLAEVAARADLPVEFVEQAWNALGMPRRGKDERAFSRRDVDALRILGALRTVADDSQLVDVVAVMGRSMAQVAAGEIELFRRGVVTRLAEAGVGELEAALRSAAYVELLVPLSDTLLRGAHHRHLEAAVRAESVLRIEEAAGSLPDQVEMCIGFADLVGFTRASTELSPLQLGELSSELLRLAERCTGEHGVRVVKSIGDAVMIAGRDAVATAAAAVDLLDATTAAGLPDLRVGLAVGPVLARHADYFGRTVNVASRLCAAAHRGAALLAVPDGGFDGASFAAVGLELGSERTHRLKGLGRTVRAVALRRRGGGGGAQDS